MWEYHNFFMLRVNFFETGDRGWRWKILWDEWLKGTKTTISKSKILGVPQPVKVANFYYWDRGQAPPIKYWWLRIQNLAIMEGYVNYISKCEDLRYQKAGNLKGTQPQKSSGELWEYPNTPITWVFFSVNTYWHGMSGWRVPEPK